MRSCRRASPRRYASPGRAGYASRAAYTQSPGYEKLIQSDYFFDLSPAVVGNLQHERSTHLITGFEKDLGSDTLFRVEGYYKLEPSPRPYVGDLHRRHRHCLSLRTKDTIENY